MNEHPTKQDEPERPAEAVSPEVQRKADRTILILYILMAIGVLLPLVLFFLFGDGSGEGTPGN